MTYETSSDVVTRHEHYTYDVFNRRIGVQIDSTGSGTYDSTEHDVYGPDTASDDLLLTTDASGTVTHRFMQGPMAHQMLGDENVAVPTTSLNHQTWLLADGQQTVRDVTDAGGNVIDHLTYDSYGNVLNQSNASTPQQQLIFSVWSGEWMSSDFVSRKIEAA